MDIYLPILLVMLQIFTFFHLNSKERLLRWFIIACIGINFLTYISRYYLSPRTNGAIWVISEYILFILMAYLSSEITALMIPKKRDGVLLAIPPTICGVLCLLSWPPTREDFFNTTFWCMMVCLATLAVGLAWRFLFRPEAIGLGLLLGCVAVSALLNGRLWDIAWILGTISLLAFRPTPAVIDNSANAARYSDCT